MAKTQMKRGGGKGKDTGRRVKKKISILNTDQVDYIDWKDANLLRRFMSDRAKIRARRVKGNNTKQQRDIAMAIKNAREMALLPYASRVTTQRGGGRRDRDGEGRGRDGEGRGPRRERPSESSGEEFEQVDAPATDAEAEATEVVTEVVTEEVES